MLSVKSQVGKFKKIRQKMLAERFCQYQPMMLLVKMFFITGFVGLLLRENLRQSPRLAENHIKTLSDIGLINVIEVNLTENSQNLLDMNKLNSIYKVILFENGAWTEHLASNYEKQREELVEENIPNAVFVKSIQKQTKKCSWVGLKETAVIDDISLKTMFKIKYAFLTYPK